MPWPIRPASPRLHPPKLPRRTTPYGDDIDRNDQCNDGHGDRSTDFFDLGRLPSDEGVADNGRIGTMSSLKKQTIANEHSANGVDDDKWIVDVFGDGQHATMMDGDSYQHMEISMGECRVGRAFLDALALATTSQYAKQAPGVSRAWETMANRPISDWGDNKRTCILEKLLVEDGDLAHGQGVVAERADERGWRRRRWATISIETRPMIAV